MSTPIETTEGHAPVMPPVMGTEEITEGAATLDQVEPQIETASAGEESQKPAGNL